MVTRFNHTTIIQILDRSKKIPSELNELLWKRAWRASTDPIPKRWSWYYKKFSIVKRTIFQNYRCFRERFSKLSEVKPEDKKSLLDIFSNSYLFLHLLPWKTALPCTHFDKVKGQVKSLLVSQIKRDFNKFRGDQSLTLKILNLRKTSTKKSLALFQNLNKHPLITIFPPPTFNLLITI